jgi:Domain of unknown function (DUF5666)
MKTMKWISRALPAMALALAACGGGSSDAGGGIDGTGGGGGGVDGTGMAYGTITGFGSVFVNGIEFSTSAATIKLDDGTVSQGDLRVGMVVRVDGSIDNRQAATITVDDAVKGRVENVLDANRLVVMGQTVLIDNQTQRADNVVPTIGDYLEVHGLVAADGVISAGFIERKTTLPSPPFAVKGFVKSHDTAASTFVVGALTVSYANATRNDMPAGSWNGLLVDVKGTACAGAPVCATLTASKVEPGGAAVSSIAKAEVEGFVASGGAASFMLGAQPVVTTASTVFEGGLPEDVVPGAKLEAEGPISGGVLTAVKVSFRDNLRFEANVAGVNAGAGTLTLTGLPGITVQTSSITEFKDVGSLAGLAAPNHVRIKARPGAGGSILALELELRDARGDARVILQGPVGSVSGSSSLTILGVTVDATTITEFQDLSDAPISRSAFFTAATPGTIVKARGDLNGSAVRWDEIELED